VRQLNDDIQATPHKKLEIAMTNQNQSGQPNQKPGQGGQQKPDQQSQQPNQKPGQGGQQK
jgi:hypothetical protein